MIDLSAILKRTLDIKLPSGNIISCEIPKEQDYIKIINLENEVRKKLTNPDSTIDEVASLKDKELRIIFMGSTEEAINELLTLNTRIKSYVTDEFIKFIANIDQDPN